MNYSIHKLADDQVYYNRRFAAPFPTPCDVVTSITQTDTHIEYEGYNHGPEDEEGNPTQIQISDSIPIAEIEEAITTSRTPKLEDLKQRALKKLEALRYEREVGGMDFMGMTIPTDRATQSKLDTAHRRASADPTYSVKWKIGFNQWVDLDAPTIIAIGDAMEAHIRGAFAWEAVKAEEINTAATQAELDAIDLSL